MYENNAEDAVHLIQFLNVIQDAIRFRETQNKISYLWRRMHDEKANNVLCSHSDGKAYELNVICEMID